MVPRSQAAELRQSASGVSTKQPLDAEKRSSEVRLINPRLHRMAWSSWKTAEMEQLLLMMIEDSDSHWSYVFVV